MTPAIKLLNKLRIRYSISEYPHVASRNFGEEAAAALNQDPQQIFKTLIAILDGNKRNPIVAMVPVACQLDLKKVASQFGCRKGELADAQLAQRVTGYVVGGISPLGQRTVLRTCLDDSALAFTEIYVSAGKRGLQIAIAPSDLTHTTNASVAKIARN